MIKEKDLIALKGYLTRETYFVVSTKNAKKITTFLSQETGIYNYHLLSKQEFIELFLKVPKTLTSKLVDAGYEFEYAHALGKALLLYANKEIPLDETKEKMLKDALLITRDDFTASTPVLFNNKQIIIVDDDSSDLFNLAVNFAMDCVDVIKYECDNSNLNAVYYQGINYTDEIKTVVTDICKHLDEGVLADDIGIITYNEAYLITLIDYLKLYHLNYQSLFPKKIKSYETIKRIITYLNDNISKYTSFFELFTKTLENNQIDDILLKNKLISVFNKYTPLNLTKGAFLCLLSDLEQATISTKQISGVIKIYPDANRIENEKYVYVIGAYNGTINYIYENSSFFTDQERSKFGLPSPQIIMEQNNDKTLQQLSERSVLFTYSETFEGHLMIRSPFINYAKPYEKKEIVIYSRDAARIELATMYDDYTLYGIRNKNLDRLAASIDEINYLKYDNSFKGVSNDVLAFFDNKLLLSYTSCNAYYNCPFAYYLSYYWKIKSNQTNQLMIGNLFHYCLEQLERNNIESDYDTNINLYVDEFIKKNPPQNEREVFYLDIYKEWIKNIYQFNRRFMVTSNMKVLDVEKQINFQLDVDKHKATITGKIDKLLASKKNNDVLYECVVDYKTGTLHLDFAKCEYGTNIQLPFYLYLLKQENNNNIPLAGLLQQVLPTSPLNHDDDKPLENQISDFYKLNGLFPSDIKDLSTIQTEINSFLRIRVGKNGINKQDASKAFSEAEINRLISLIAGLVKRCIKNIYDGNFDIRPYKYDGDKTSCEYCQFRDICYVKNNDYQNVTLDKDLTFIRGDKDE